MNAREANARGGRTAQAKLTTEERRRRGRKAARRMTKAERSAARVKAWETRRAKIDEVRGAAESGERPIETLGLPGAQQLEALAEAAGLKGAVVKVEQAPKRSEPKAGTISAIVLAYLYRRTMRGKGARTLEDIAEGTGLTNAQASNALSSLRSGGHVVSEPKPGSRREKLWRLA